MTYALAITIAECQAKAVFREPRAPLDSWN